MVTEHEPKLAPRYEAITDEQAAQLGDAPSSYFLIDREVHPASAWLIAHRWNTESETWDVYSPPVTVPSEIANWRARAVLEIAGHLPGVEAAIASLEGDAGVVARAAWNSGAPLARNGLTVLTLSPVLGLTPEQIDAMFIQAAALTV